MVSQITLLALASTAAALMITSPTKNQLWDLSKPNTIEWNAVNTDPQTFDIYLSHMATQPATNTLLIADANKDTGSFVVKDLQLPVGETYQINFVAHNKPEQIYAQSQQFNTTGEAIAATSTLDGYTGPTYTPTTAGGAAQTSATSASEGETSTRSGSSVTRTTLRTLTTTSSGTVVTQTTSAVTTEDADATATSAGQTNAGSATQSTSTPTATPNAAVGSGASAPLAALVFGIAAFFL